MYLHRFLFEQKNGCIPEGLIVRHMCDNVFCINVDHMELGTHQDNVDDMISRGRNAMGSRVGSSRLTEDDVTLIREMFAGGATGIEIAKHIGISHQSVYNVRNNKTWSHMGS